MHITAEDIVVEIVDPQGKVLPPGIAGEIVTTHLATRVRSSVIARVTWDARQRSSALWSGCRCSKEIQGRTTDFVVAADGTVMHGLALVYPIRELPGIEAFRSCRND